MSDSSRPPHPPLTRHPARDSDPRRLEPIAAADPETAYSSMLPPGMPSGSFSGGGGVGSGGFEGFNSGGAGDVVPAMGIPGIPSLGLGMGLNPASDSAYADGAYSPGPVSVTTPPPQRAELNFGQ